MNEWILLVDIIIRICVLNQKIFVMHIMSYYQPSVPMNYYGLSHKNYLFYSKVLDPEESTLPQEHLFLF